MARIQAPDAPDVQAPENQGEPYVRAQASPADFGGQIAQSAEKLGGGVVDLSKYWGEVQTDTALNDAMSKASGIVENYRSLSGQDALDAQDAVKEQINQTFNNSADNLHTTYQRQRFLQAARPFQERYILGQIDNHATQQGHEFTLSQNNARSGLGLNTISSAPNDDDAFDLGRHFVRSGMIKNLALKGLDRDPDIVADTLMQADRTSYEARIRSLLSDPSNLTNVGRAKQIMDDKRDILAQSPHFDTFAAKIDDTFDRANANAKANEYIGQMAQPGQMPGPTSGRFNIGNVKTPSGAAAGTSDFVDVDSPVDGVNLAATTLRSGYQGLTLEQIAKKWAPKNDHNDPMQWAQNVSRASGIPIDAAPNLNDPQQLANLVRGIGVAEKRPSELTAFTPAVIQQGVQASLSGQSPKTIKANMLMDEATVMDRIDKDYSSDPRQASLIKAQVRQKYQEVKMASDSIDLANRTLNDETLRSAGDAIRANPTADLQPFFDKVDGQGNHILKEQQVEYLRNLRAKELDERTTGRGNDPGPEFDDTRARILDSSRSDRILWQEQLNQLQAQGKISLTGYRAATELLGQSRKDQAGVDTKILNDFLQDARQAITLYDPTFNRDIIEGQIPKWHTAQRMLLDAIPKAKEQGMTLAQMTDREDPKSLWKLLGEPGGPFLPSQEQTTVGMAQHDAAAAQPLNPETLKDWSSAFQAYQHQPPLITYGQLRDLVVQHPEWGIKFKNPPAGAQTSEAPAIPER